MKYLLITLIALLVGGCARETGNQALLPGALVPAVISASVTTEAQPTYAVSRKLFWPASTSPGIAYYEVQQATNILSRQFFDLTNVVALSVIVLATNQSGTWRVRTVNGSGIGSAWAYLSL